MDIALLGYGKMGRLIEATALARGHRIAARIDAHTGRADLGGADVAIDFSTPAAAPGNLLDCAAAGIPAVCGTTGWTERYPEICDAVEKAGTALLYSSNFSLGVNLFFELNSLLARLMEPYPPYRPAIEEIHHIHKLDAPSGTAISLAESILAVNPRYDRWEPAQDGTPFPQNALAVRSIREGENPGVHTVRYTGPVDAIEIRHEAFSREGFALGAVLAAEWIVGRHGIYSMRDVLFPQGATK